MGDAWNGGDVCNRFIRSHFFRAKKIPEFAKGLAKVSVNLKMQ